jgi:hypothetical protein
MNTGKEKLRQDILDKFGSVKYFCKVSEISYRKFITFLNSKRNNEALRQEARHLCDTIKVEHIDGIIRDEDREAIRICIVVKSGSLTNFCKENTNFDTVYISNIVTGRLETETEKYKLLVKILERDYDLVLRKEVTE